MDDSVIPDPDSQTRWIVRFMSKPGAMVFFVIEVEVMLEENEDEPTLCVLHKVGISQRTLERVMDTFEERLSTPRLHLPLPPSPPPGGAPDQP